MAEISYALRCKPSWWTKYKDPQILAKWRAELLDHESKVEENEQLSEEEIDYVLAELAGYDKMRDESTGIQQSCYTRVYETDSLIPEDLRQRLMEAVKPLENVPDEQKDWHPRSDNQVLDLVHPSLYCGVYGRTLAYPVNKDSPVPKADDLKPLNNEDHGRHIRNPRWVAKWAISDKFAWIPTDFDIAEGGKSAKALGYINNLHPSHHSELYTVIEGLVARFTFLWDRVLTDLHPKNPVPYRIGGWYEWVEDENNPEPDEEDFEDYEAYEEAHEEWEESRTLITPTVPKEGYTKDISARNEIYSVQGRKIQVIVKLANILLTPDKPKYPGGSWHVEGMANERIIASGIYYYESENITESRLAFRAAVGQGNINYLQGDGLGLKLTYGLDDSTEGNQMLGAVKTLAGRCIAFPNVFQHQVSSFELSDLSKPGHRKIVALFLVDPEYTVPSTTHIAPQQSDWARDAMNTTGTLFSKMPAEVLDMVTGSARREGSLMTLEEAKQYRLELMDERAAYVKDQNQEYFARDFSFYTLIPEDLRQKLVESVESLGDIFAEPNIQRAQANHQVLDVLDPSLYCGVYGRTLTYPLEKDPSSGAPKEVKSLDYGTDASHVRECPEWAASRRFTWIPTDFDLAADGQSAKALGYINNIHPSRHSDLRTIIEEIVARFSFLWDRVLTDLHPDNPLPYRIDDSYDWEDSKKDAPLREEYDDYYYWRDAMKDWRKDLIGRVIRPTVPDDGYTEDISERKTVYSIKGKKLQVFVRLFNIILTPENPEYLDESWHVEGMANERIVACGVFCYDSENTTDMKLSVRSAVQECRLVDNLWEPEYGLETTYGLSS
ncbi:hypothetical protein FRC01_001569 [Tulasnella sp. 417]|nr:hypothetical protein FRC01_001569 [Tulasnella sp. 417]